jgi:D-glycero-alpha-D-manno-heptose 1-phosphate guanylyltransferase
VEKDIPVIVLAGGLGTRLRSVIADLPKPMAIINGKPFLHYVFLYLTKQRISKAILAVGYKSMAIESYFGDKYLDVKIEYSLETEPLGTGGGIRKAFSKVDDIAYVLNGDTFFDVTLQSLYNFHKETAADISLALKPMSNFDRYGTVELAGDKIIQFNEKKYTESGLINGGVYILSKKVFGTVGQEKFSFEKEVLEQHVTNKRICGKVFNDYFIDIGIPEDFSKAQEDFKLLF